MLLKGGTCGGIKYMQHNGYEDALDAYENGYYAEKLSEGLEFQDYVTHTLYKHGIVVVNYGSKKYQNEHGENILGAEIKRDNNFRKTGNLYIEVSEKAHPDRPNYTQSGIFRDDNGWLFVIGDEQTIWIFQTNILTKLHGSTRYRVTTTPTSVGMLLPIADADKYAGKKIEMKI